MSSEGNVEAPLERLLQKCEELVEHFEYDLALKFCEKILALEPKQVEALEMKATILIDNGDFETAKSVLRDAIASKPDSGEEKYIALAQLLQGHEALATFKEALRILSNNSETEDKRKQTASIYCLMAELYMTDLCMEGDAEVNCENLIKLALEAVPNDYEALQTMANMRLSQNRVDDALSSLMESIKVWSAIPFGTFPFKFSSLHFLESDDHPSYEFRLICCRLLVELGSFEIAKQILEKLSQEDDGITEVWYLLALTQYSIGDYKTSNESLEIAELMIESEEPVEEILEAISELRDALNEVGPIEDEELEYSDSAGSLEARDMIE